ncbi:MAG: hypothetical protein JWN38_1134 [Candidatus Saccharibacteria bacterium]|nr:hypothetical protein [Candidatus Saccharibacteria bacterium]
MNMIPNRELLSMAYNLRAFDIEQGAWPHESEGFEANAQHALEHLASDMVTKNFNDEDTILREIAPDALSFALRLNRWADLKPVENGNPDETPLGRTRSTVLELRPHYGDLETSHIAYIGAVGTLASHLRDLRHPDKRELAQTARPEVVRNTASLLQYCVEQQMKWLGFNYRSVFHLRLRSLRDELGIPQPKGVPDEPITDAVYDSLRSLDPEFINW